MQKITIKRYTPVGMTPRVSINLENDRAGSGSDSAEALLLSEVINQLQLTNTLLALQLAHDHPGLRTVVDIFFESFNGAPRSDQQPV